MAAIAAVAAGGEIGRVQPGENADWRRPGVPAQQIERVRAVAPTLPLLIPGVGAQGGDAVATVKAARIGGGPIIINSSRAILYAGQGDDFAKAAREAAIATRATLQAAAQS